MSQTLFRPYAGKPSFSGTTDCPDELVLIFDAKTAMKLARQLIDRAEWLLSETQGLQAVTQALPLSLNQSRLRRGRTIR